MYKLIIAISLTFYCTNSFASCANDTSLYIDSSQFSPIPTYTALESTPISEDIIVFSGIDGAGSNIASFPLQFDTSSLISIEDIFTDGPQDTVGTLYKYEFGQISKIVEVDDRSNTITNRLFKIEDIIVDDNVYCLDVREFSPAINLWATTLRINVAHINDIISFPSTSIEVVEGSDLAISVNLSRALTNNFNYSIYTSFQGEAESNLDYSFPYEDQGMKTIPAGEQIHSINIPIRDDSIIESNEEFALEFDVDNTVLSRTIVTIIDNDTPAQENRNPVLLVGNIPSLIFAGSSFAHTVQASDPDGDDLTFSLENNPEWLSINSETGVLSGKPEDKNIGEAQGIKVVVSDGEGGEASNSFGFSVVAAPNNPPVITVGNIKSKTEAKKAFTHTINASDPDGDTVTYLLENNPNWLVIDRSTGVISGTPSSSDVGINQNIKIIALDGKGGEDSTKFNLEVTPPPNKPPVITIGNIKSKTEVSKPFTHTINASDPDGDAVTYVLEDNPDWLNINRTTGVLSGTPTDTDVGVNQNIKVIAQDGNGGKASARFNLEVTKSSGGGMTDLMILICLAVIALRRKKEPVS